MIGLLIYLIFFVIIAGLIYYLVTLLPLPAPFKVIIQVLAILILILILFYFFQGYLPPMHPYK